MKLVDDVTGREVKVGDLTYTFRNEAVRVVGIREPAHRGSTGRVTLCFVGEEENEHESEFDYFPGVINAHWEGGEE